MEVPSAGTDSTAMPGSILYDPSPGKRPRVAATGGTESTEMPGSASSNPRPGKRPRVAATGGSNAVNQESPLLLLPEEALRLILSRFTGFSLCTTVALVCPQLLLLCLSPCMWGIAADVTGIGAGMLKRMIVDDALAHCANLRCDRLWEKLLASPPPYLRQVDMVGRAICAEFMAMAARLPQVCIFTLREGVGRWRETALPEGWCLSAGATPLVALKSSVPKCPVGLRNLQILRVQTRDTGFSESADLWLSSLFPVLEELCWSIHPYYENPKSRKKAYNHFLRRLGALLDDDLLQRRPRLRVCAYNDTPLPPKLSVRCSVCRAILFSGENVYALGPGTQRHIDCEAYVWGHTIQELTTSGIGEHNCPYRCFEEDDIFLVAARGSFIHTGGFNYACACGPELAELSPAPNVDAAATASAAQDRSVENTARSGASDDGWFADFLRRPGSISAPRPFRRSRISS